MKLELYVTLSELNRLPRGVPYSEKVLMCRAEKICASRPREFHSGRVFNLSGKLLDGDYKEHCEETYAHIYFYGDWAFAASFIELNDIVVLSGFILYDIPCIGDDKAEFYFFVTPIVKSSSLRVLQNMDQGDTMEVTVKANMLDVPSVRVLPKTLLAPFLVNDVK